MKDKVVTPGLKRKVENVEQDHPLPPEDVTKFRQLAARANYLSLDRPDIAFAAKECCRHMSGPGNLDWVALLRIARYLVGKPRLQYKFPWRNQAELEVYADTDFAGCLDDRKPTLGEGGCV